MHTQKRSPRTGSFREWNGLREPYHALFKFWILISWCTLQSQSHKSYNGKPAFLSLFLAFAMIDIEEGGRKRKQQNQNPLNPIFRLQLEMPRYFKVVTNMHIILSLKGLILWLGQIVRNKCLTSSGVHLTAEIPVSRRKVPSMSPNWFQKIYPRTFWPRDHVQLLICPFSIVENWS